MSEITPTNSTPINISGIVLNILHIQSGTSKAGNQWQKQDFILETGGQYPRKVCICLFGDNVDKFPLQVGQSVTASVDIESREFNGRWYTDIRAWNIVYNGQQQGAPAPAPTDTARTNSSQGRSGTSPSGRASSRRRSPLLSSPQ